MRTSSLISACVALFFSTGDARLDGSSNVPQYVSDHGEGSLTISHTWKSKTKLPRRMSDMTATTYGDAVYLVGGCAQDQGYMEFSGDNSTWGYCEFVSFLLTHARYSIAPLRLPCVDPTLYK